MGYLIGIRGSDRSWGVLGYLTGIGRSGRSWGVLRNLTGTREPGGVRPELECDWKQGVWWEMGVWGCLTGDRMAGGS